MRVAVSQHRNFVGGEWVDSTGGPHGGFMAKID
jgi:hypothetical protein